MKPSLGSLAGVVGVVVALHASGCATITQGSHADLDIQTRPSKAQIWIDGIQQGESPTKVAVAVDKPHVVVIRAPGYKEQTIQTEPLIGGGYVAADFFLGLFPLIVDAATGSWYKVNPNPMRIMLAPEAGEPQATAAATEGATP